MKYQALPAERIRCLWISRYIPFPLEGGAQIYSANLAQSLARAGALVRFMGLGNTCAVPESAGSVQWLGVPGGKRNAAVAALSSLPFAAAGQQGRSPGHDLGGAATITAGFGRAIRRFLKCQSWSFAARGGRI